MIQSRITNHESRTTVPRRFCFGVFELDERSGELRRDGVKVRLQEQPFQALLMLIAHAGEVVTREELQKHVWRDETFVDFDHGLNSIVNRLREALGDSAESPVFIQTLPRRGYRFLAPVEERRGGVPVGVEERRGGVPVDVEERRGGVPVDVEERREGVPVDAEEVSPTRAAPASAPPSSAAPQATTSEVVETAHAPPRGLARRIVMIAAVAALVAGAYVARRLIVPRLASPGTGQARLAVLPLANLTGDSEQQFFVDGLHEEMIFRLGRMQPQRLAVVARTSVMPYRGESQAIAAIARDLDVDYVLEGSVRRSGERFRITAQLIRADDESHLWTETYDRGWKDLFAIQTDVGARVADSLAVELMPSYQAAVQRDAKVSPQAYEHYLRGRFYWNQRTRDMSLQLARAIEQFKLAIAAEPGYAQAYVGLADAYDSIVFANPEFGQDAYPKAREAIQRALQLDEELAAAHATLAWMAMHFERDWALAERAFRRALELDPNDSLARFRYSHLLAVRGRLPEAESEAQAARQTDPLSAPIMNILAWYSFYGGADTQALLRMREAADLDGNPTRFHVFGAYVYAVRRQCDRAAAELGRLPNAADAFPRVSEAAFALARCGDATLAEGLRQELVARRMAFAVAMIHFGLGQIESFHEWLDRAIDARSPEVLYIAVDPAFTHERRDPRFQAALRRLGL